MLAIRPLHRLLPSRSLSSSPLLLLPQRRLFTKKPTTRIRRRRRQGLVFDNPTPTNSGTTQERPGLFNPSQKEFNEYLKEASLSPWVPTPDPVARRMLEIANVKSDDVHYDLGSGDGRLNFTAIDFPFHVKKSIGYDIDDSLIQTSHERLTKRHPPPTNISFIKKDLLMEHDDIDWEECTVVTMYFVEEALLKLKPVLEMRLGGSGVRVVTCGYEMKGWTPKWTETMLGLSMNMYVMDETLHGVKEQHIFDVGDDTTNDGDDQAAVNEKLPEVSLAVEPSDDDFFKSYESDDEDDLFFENDDETTKDSSESENKDDEVIDDTGADNDDVEVIDGIIDDDSDDGKESRWKW